MDIKTARVELPEANEFVKENHRHHKPVTGHRFSVGASLDGKLVGVAIVGRPVAPKTDQKMIAEVARLCTNDVKNSCSFLYSKCARIAKEMGFSKIQTFILESESGVSLKAAGWICEGVVKTTSSKNRWNSRPGRSADKQDENKLRWAKYL